MSTVRMQFEVPIEKALEIEALAKECGFETKKDFFNNAITLLKWAVRHTKAGNIIASVNRRDEKYTEFSMPFIEHIRENLFRELRDRDREFSSEIQEVASAPRTYYRSENVE